MEINLLPPKPYVERRYWFFFVLVITIIGLAAVYAAQIYVNKLISIPALEAEVQQLKLEQVQIEKNMEWNQNVEEIEQQLNEMLKYQAFTNGLSTGLGPDWSEMLRVVQSVLPPQTSILTLMANGNQIEGTASFRSVVEVSKFMDDLQNMEQVKRVSLRTMNGGIIHFTIVANDLYFLTGAKS